MCFEGGIIRHSNTDTHMEHRAHNLCQCNPTEMNTFSSSAVECLLRPHGGLYEFSPSALTLPIIFGILVGLSPIIISHIKINTVSARLPAIKLYTNRRSLSLGNLPRIIQWSHLECDIGFYAHFMCVCAIEYRIDGWPWQPTKSGRICILVIIIASVIDVSRKTLRLLWMFAGLFVRFTRASV